MAIVVTNDDTSFPLVAGVYLVTGLVNGANVITLPTPPAQGSFPPAGDWTPKFVFCFPYNPGAIGSLVTPDISSITNASGLITFTVYAASATDCLMFVA